MKPKSEHKTTQIIQPMDNCWSKIGVWGSQTPRCSALEDLIHCHNCAVYTDAGRSLLMRPPPEGYLDAWTELLSHKDLKIKTETISVIVFRIGDEWLSLPTRIIQEVSEMRPMHRIPHAKGSVVKGIVSVRGELKIWVSIGEMLGIKKGEKWEDIRSITNFYERLVILEQEGDVFVFPVSEIVGSKRINISLLQKVPSTIANSMSTYLSGMFESEGKNVGFLDGELVVDGLRKSLL